MPCCIDTHRMRGHTCFNKTDRSDTSIHSSAAHLSQLQCGSCGCQVPPRGLWLTIHTKAGQRSSGYSVSDSKNMLR